MLKYIWILFLTCALNAEELRLSADCEPLLTVANCVNVASGHFFQIDKNLIDRACDPLHFTLYYDSGQKTSSYFGEGFGCQFGFFATQTDDSHVLVEERDGFNIPYKKDAVAFTIDPKILEKGYTNVSRSGFGNFVNFKASFEKDRGTVNLGSLIERSYQKGGERYYLKKERKANGNVTRFEYQARQPTKVVTYNCAGQHKLSELLIERSETECRIRSLSGEYVSYLSPCEWIRQVIPSSGVPKTYQMCRIEKQDNTYSSKVKRITWPEGRFLEVEYSSDQQVKVLYGPYHGDKIALYQFDYHKKHTDVRDALGQLSVYRFDICNRLSAIDYYEANDIIKRERFFWSTAPGEEGWLKSKFLCSVPAFDVKEEATRFYHGTVFEYDARGNVIRETFCGNLTGAKKQSFNLIHDDSYESYSKTYIYNEANLLIEESTPQGLTIRYGYLAGTNLITHQLTCYEGKIQERLFRFYNENGQVWQTIEDDGSSPLPDDLTDVFMRTVTTTTYGANLLPEWVIHSYVQEGQVIPLKKMQYTYDARGREIACHVFTDALCYTLKKTWDDKSRLMTETDALNQLTRYVWDENGNKIEEELIGSNKVTVFGYDTSNRLVKKEERCGSDIFTTLYTYNPLGQLILTCDPYGQCTDYTYDRLGRLIQCMKPAMQNSQGHIFRPTIQYKHNLLDQVVEEIDENGELTKKSYNAYGKVTSIFYPDGTSERFVYYLNGWLQCKWNTEGISTRYGYDAKGHLVNESTFDAANNLLKVEEYGYKGSLLIFKKDPMGVVTTYKYDGAGRKIAEVEAGIRIDTFSYDALGRMIQINRGEELCEILHYDYLDRITEKETKDRYGNLYAKKGYVYDIFGHIESVTKYYDQVAITYTHYKPTGEIEYEIDALGAKTHYFYEYGFVNPLQQKVRRRAKTDPLGRVTVIEEDAYGRSVRETLFDITGPASYKEFAYDPKGRKTLEKEVVYAKGQVQREYAQAWTYNNKGLVETETEWPSQRLKRYLYDVRGRLIQKQKPSGNILYYSYDPLDRLIALSSSDQTVAYTYRYDLKNHPIETYDVNQGLVQRRIYDALGRLTYEEFLPNVALQFSYDALGRPLQMTLPDGSQVEYAYNAKYLCCLKRLNKELNHFTYNLMGQLRSYQTPMGAITRSFDKLGRKVKTSAPSWQEELLQFDAVGNLLACHLQDQAGECYNHFTYDALNQLSYENGESFVFDSLHNCVEKNGKPVLVNTSNQVVQDTEYDLNGNLVRNGNTRYTYDALDRLIRIDEQGQMSAFLYDPFGRCIQAEERGQMRRFFYQSDVEIGSLEKGVIKEFRTIHPQTLETLSIELAGQFYIPVQDHRLNICALLQTKESYRYSAFGIEKPVKAPINPWRFAGKRAFGSLIYFGKRFYDPSLGRFLSPDPAKDGLNLYAYVRNNPFTYTDPNGLNSIALKEGATALAIVIPVIKFSFGACMGPVVLPTMLVLGTACIAYGTYHFVSHTDYWMNSTYNQVQTDEENVEKIEGIPKGRKRGKDNQTRGGPLRDPKTANYLPDPQAEGTPHTTIGTRDAKYGPYTQGATFDEKGEFKERIDVTAHGRYDHPNPHFHLATSPNGADSPAQPIPDYIY